MEISGIELRYLITEIVSKTNLGYYVSNINAVTRDSLLFRLHHPLESDMMLIVSSRGIWFTKLRFKPIEDNPILNIIKSQIERAKIESIEQHGSERIVMIKFKLLDNSLRIIVAEFFGGGNMILCDENLQILSILNPIEVRHRTLKVGLRYVPPPIRGTDVFNFSLDTLFSIRRTQENDLELSRWLGRTISMPKKFVEEIIRRAETDTKEASQLSDSDLTRIYSCIRTLVTDVTLGKNHEPIVIIDEQGKPVDALPIITYTASKLKIKKVSSYMDAVDEVLSNFILDQGRNMKTIEMSKQVAILEHDIIEQNKAKDEVIAKAAAIRKFANELMMLHSSGFTSFDDIDRIETLLTINSANIIKEKGIKYIKLVDELIPLESSLPKVSSMLFTRAKEMERGSLSIDEAKGKLLEQIDKLRNRTAAIHKKIVVKQQVSKEWFERYRWFITSDGLLAIGGRDASSNSVVVRKHLTDNDLVFHAEVYGSPFFIIKNASVTQNIDLSLLQVAQATVAFSRAWKDGLFSADAYWVNAYQIKKGAPTGQFLPKGSFVIEGKRNYIKGVEIRLAIGIMYLNSRYIVVCGPSDAIRQRSHVYSILIPGGMDPMNAAKKIKSELINAVIDDYPLENFIKTTNVDDIIRAIPYGHSKISFTGKGKGEREQIAGMSSSDNDEQSN
jgi:predicted ribosome quality control (RQC) complex YloA/Tae2 family protein